jgi:hypothetical protein
MEFEFVIDSAASCLHYHRHHDPLWFGILRLTSEGISLHERDGFHILCEYRCNPECQPFTLLNETGSADCRSWAVTLFVFVINSEFIQNFQLMPCHIAFKVQGNSYVPPGFPTSAARKPGWSR